MNQFDPPDNHHLSAAIGWIGLGNWQEADEELEKVAPKLRAHPDVLNNRLHIYIHAKKWDVCIDTIDHEVGNAQKCLRAGFLRVAVICQDEARLRKIENSIVTSLGPDVSKQVSYFYPDQFIAHLKELAATLAVPPPASTPASTSKRVRKGWEVSTTAKPLSSDEHLAREQATIAQMAALMKKKV